MSIAFVSQSATKDQMVWIEKLAERMPDETILTYDELSEAAKGDVEIAIVADPDPAKLASLPKLVWVHSLWAGVETMMRDLKDAPFNIVRLQDPEMARKMAEAVLAWVLYLHRDMPAYARQQRERLWRERPHTKAYDRHIGLVGLGNLGIEAATTLAGLGFQVSGWSRSPKQVDGIMTHHGDAGLTDMLAAVDIVVCLIPLTDQTRGLMNEIRFGAMRRGAALINFARGPIVDTAALLSALDDGSLSHAVLDVFDEEPLPTKSPLWTHEKITVLPHISGPTNRDTASDIVAANIARYRETGELPITVDKTKGY
ncbi:MAG: glyoxylate/hydroxypyruvate reductase A [Pseudomonadota bacterium]